MAISLRTTDALLFCVVLPSVTFYNLYQRHKDIMPVLQRIDVDGDGTITNEEWAEAKLAASAEEGPDSMVILDCTIAVPSLGHHCTISEHHRHEVIHHNHSQATAQPTTPKPEQWSFCIDPPIGHAV